MLGSDPSYTGYQESKKASAIPIARQDTIFVRLDSFRDNMANLCGRLNDLAYKINGPQPINAPDAGIVAPPPPDGNIPAAHYKLDQIARMIADMHNTINRLEQELL